MLFPEMVKWMRHILPAICLMLLASAGSTTHAQNSATAELPRHVILIIGDGMDDHQITIARNYLVGAPGRLLLDDMPLRSTSQVLTIEDKVGGKAIYVADSANTATTMASGVITSRGRIATTAGDNQPIATIVEMAEAAGYKTGIVSTASVTDATPASFAAHISLRFCENPETMLAITYKDIYLGNCLSERKSQGGLGSISEQLASSGLDVILGGGMKHFAMAAEGGTASVADVAKNNGFALLTTSAELKAAGTDKPLLGLFSASTMPVRLQGENGRKAEEPEPSLLHYIHRYLGEVTLPATMNCESNPKFAKVPTLKAMTDAALSHLSHNNDRGFFLMVESASIDKQSHERKPCGSIGELEQLNEALESALAFAEKHPRTLILVTADHAQAAQLIPNVSLFAEYPIPVYTPGKLARINTPEGSILAVNYATNNFPYSEHTGANVPLFSNREGVGIVPSYIQQADIFTISREYLKLDPRLRGDDRPPARG
jgi:alkaline phosphatase